MDFADPPPDDGYLTSAEMVAVEADRLKGLDSWDEAGNAPGARVWARPHGRDVEVWFTNPDRYLPTLERVPYPRFVHQINRAERTWKTNPFTMLDKVLPLGYDFEVLVISQDYALRYTRRLSHPSINAGTIVPVERVPVWKFGDDPEELIRMCRAYPRRGWSRIVVGYLPRPGIVYRDEAKTMVERTKCLSWLHKVCLAFPDVKIHFNDGTHYREMFGLAFSAADFDPGSYARSRVVLPSGERVHVNQAKRRLKWLHVLGYSASDLSSQADRVMFNMHSALWAAENFTSPEALANTRNGKRDDPYGLLGGRRGSGGQRSKAVERTDLRMGPLELTPDYLPMYGSDPDEPYAYAEPVTNAPLVPIRARKPQTMDKLLCDACSLAPTCRYVRAGGLCIVSGSEAAKLVRLFGTRDAEVVKEGLTGVLAVQAQRHAKMAEAWDQTVEEIKEAPVSVTISKSKHLMEMETSLMRGGEALIRILDPDTHVQSNVPAIVAGTIQSYNPATLVADVVKRLEEKGIDRASIDPSTIVDVAREHGILPLEGS